MVVLSERINNGHHKIDHHYNDHLLKKVLQPRRILQTETVFTEYRFSTSKRNLGRRQMSWTWSLQVAHESMIIVSNRAPLRRTTISKSVAGVPSVHWLFVCTAFIPEHYALHPWPVFGAYFLFAFPGIQWKVAPGRCQSEEYAWKEIQASVHVTIFSTIEIPTL